MFSSTTLIGGLALLLLDSASRSPVTIIVFPSANLAIAFITPAIFLSVHHLLSCVGIGFPSLSSPLSTPAYTLFTFIPSFFDTTSMYSMVHGNSVPVSENTTLTLSLGNTLSTRIRVAVLSFPPLQGTITVSAQSLNCCKNFIDILSYNSITCLFASIILSRLIPLPWNSSITLPVGLKPSSGISSKAIFLYPQ